MKNIVRVLLITISVTLTMLRASGQPTLSEVFRNPPQEARPLIIWQWMDGMVSRQGITHDLETYAEAGLGGVQQFQVGGPEQGWRCRHLFHQQYARFSFHYYHMHGCCRT